MKPIIIHVPHASMYIPEEYRRTALISQEELEAENRFMCDTGIVSVMLEINKRVLREDFGKRLWYNTNP